MRVAAAHKPPVDQRLLSLRCLLRRGAERMWLRRGVVDVVTPHERAELVVVELAFGQARTLFEHDHRVSRRREFLRDDAAGRAGADDDEVHRHRLDGSARSVATVAPSVSPVGVGVVIPERRLKAHLVLESQHVPSHVVAIAAPRRKREACRRGVDAGSLKEGCRFDVANHLVLLGGGEGSEAGSSGELWPAPVG